MRTLYICGAGNSEGVRLAIRVNREAHRWERMLILDDDEAKHGRALLDVEIAGSFKLLEQANPETDEVVNMVARSTGKRYGARRKIAEYGIPFTPLVDPTVDISGTELAQDVLVYQGSIVGPEVSIGDGSVVFMGAIVGHESHLRRGCVVAPGACINARVILGDGTYVGANAAILPEVKVGRWATIGAASLVMQDVPDGTTVMGVPSKTVVTLKTKLRMPGVDALPDDVREEFERQAV